MTLSRSVILLGSLLAMAIVALYVEWRRESDLARRHLWTALMLGILAGSARLFLVQNSLVVRKSSLALPWGWQLLGDVVLYGAFAAIGMVSSARSGLVGVLLSEGGGWADWQRFVRYGLGLAIPLLGLRWLGYRWGMWPIPNSSLAFECRSAIIVAAQEAIHQEIIFRLALLPLLSCFLASLPRVRRSTLWPLGAGVIISTLLWGIIYLGEGPLLTALLGLALGLAFIRAGWEAAVLLHFLWLAWPLIGPI